MSTLRYGIACSYFTFVLNAIITVMMFSVFLRIFNRDFDTLCDS